MVIEWYTILIVYKQTVREGVFGFQKWFVYIILTHREIRCGVSMCTHMFCVYACTFVCNIVPKVYLLSFKLIVL